MEDGLGRIKWLAPKGQGPDSKCRELIHNDHGGSTLGTAENSRLGGRTGRRREMGLGIILRQAQTEGKKFASPAIGQESEGTDADEATGQNVQEKSS